MKGGGGAGGGGSTRFSTAWRMAWGESKASSSLTVAKAAGWPRGTVTFLFTDIVDSTLLWERYPQVMPQALVHHDALVHSAIGAYGGVVFKTLGDAVCAAFVRAPDALAAACAIQQSLGAEDWRRFGLPPERPLRVRMAIHTGMADPRHGDYVGPPLNRAARILSAGHGGQVLLSLAARELVADALPEGVSLRDLGTYQLRGLHGTGAGRPERLFLAAFSTSALAIAGVAACHPDLLPELAALVVRGDLSLEREVMRAPMSSYADALAAIREGRLLRLLILRPEPADVGRAPDSAAGAA